MKKVERCPADAPNAGKSSESSASEHGTPPAPSSGLDGLTLFERMMVEGIRTLIDQNDQIIELLMAGPEQSDEDDVPTHYLNGQRIS
jgi:hypothetical protein